MGKIIWNNNWWYDFFILPVTPSATSEFFYSDCIYKTLNTSFEITKNKGEHILFVTSRVKYTTGLNIQYAVSYDNSFFTGLAPLNSLLTKTYKGFAGAFLIKTLVSNYKYLVKQYDNRKCYIPFKTVAYYVKQMKTFFMIKYLKYIKKISNL